MNSEITEKSLENIVEPRPIELNINLKIEYLFDKMLLNPDFSNRLKVSIDNIMRDGKIDQYDIPEIIFIISDILNQQPSLKLTSDDLVELVKKIYYFIVKKYNLIQDPIQEASFNRLIESSLRLLMIQPNIKKGCNFIIGKFNSCSK
jgi:hypothetical protein